MQLVLMSAASTNHREVRQNFIARHWRGELPLGISYWLVGFLGNLGLLLFAYLATWPIQDDYEPLAIFASLSSIWLAIIVVATWQVVGVWRSASRRIRERRLENKRAVWAVLAKVAVVLGVLRIAADVAGSGFPQVKEVYRMAFMGDPDIPAYALRTMRDGREVEIAGGLKYGVTDAFLHILSESPRIEVVHLNSIGGRIGEAIKLNEVIKARGLRTYVSSHCLSACTLAFAGGRERWIKEGAEIGFHGPAFPGMTKADLADAVNDQAAILAAAGIDRWFIDKALETPSEDIWSPPLSELTAAHVVTNVSHGDDFAVSGFGVDVTREGLALTLLENWPALTTMSTRFPNDYDSVVDAFYENYLTGETEGETVTAVRTKLDSFLAIYRQAADGEVLAEFARLFAEQYAALASKSPADCYEFASNTGADSTADIPGSLVEREDALNERAILTATDRPSVAEEMTAPLWDRVFADLAGRGFRPESIGLLRGGAVDPSDYGDYCDAAIALFEVIGGLKAEEAGLLMREMLRKE